MEVIGRSLWGDLTANSRKLAQETLDGGSNIRFVPVELGTVRMVLFGVQVIEDSIVGLAGRLRVQKLTTTIITAEWLATCRNPMILPEF